MLRALVLPRRGFFSCVAAMPQYLEFASSQWNRPVASHVFRRGPGGFPHSHSDPGPEKVMKPRIISLRRGFFISPVVTGASASVGALFVVTDVLGAPRCVASRGVGFGRRPFCCSVQACLVGVTNFASKSVAT